MIVSRYLAMVLKIGSATLIRLVSNKHSLQCVERSQLPKVNISLTTHDHLLRWWLYGKQQQQTKYFCVRPICTSASPSSAVSSCSTPKSSLKRFLYFFDTSLILLLNFSLFLSLSFLLHFLSPSRF